MITGLCLLLAGPLRYIDTLYWPAIHCLAHDSFFMSVGSFGGALMRPPQARHSAFIAVALFCAIFFALQVAAQKPLEPEDQSKEPSKVVTVEVTPSQTTAAIGSKLQFKAVGKDADGNVLPDAPKYWYAAPFDAAGAGQDGEVSFFQPGEITVG